MNEFIYKTKQDETILPKFITLDKSHLDRETFELGLELKEQFGLPTMSDLLNVAIHYLDETKSKADKTPSIMKNLQTYKNSINPKDSDFLKQNDITVMKKISEDSYGGVEH